MMKDKEKIYELMGDYFYDCSINGCSDFREWCEENIENNNQKEIMNKIEQNVDAIAWILFSDEH